jgi:ribonuclease VapC
VIKRVFDASAILAVYYGEPGKKKVRSLLETSQPLMSAANLCEVLTKLLEDGLEAGSVWDTFQALEIEIADFDAASALKAAELRPVTKHLGLSLGDRACLALAIQENAAAVTSDKSWGKLDVCEIEIIR